MSPPLRPELSPRLARLAERRLARLSRQGGAPAAAGPFVPSTVPSPISGQPGELEARQTDALRQRADVSATAPVGPRTAVPFETPAAPADERIPVPIGPTVVPMRVGQVPGLGFLATVTRIGGRALSMLPGRAGEFGERIRAAGEAGQQAIAQSREQAPTAALPAELVDIGAEFALADRIPFLRRLMGRGGMPAVPRARGVFEGGRLVGVRPSVTGVPTDFTSAAGRIARAGAAEGRRFGVLEGAIAAGEGEYEQIPERALGGAVGGAAFGLAGQTAREALAAGVRAGLETVMRRQVPSMTAPRMGLPGAPERPLALPPGAPPPPVRPSPPSIVPEHVVQQGQMQQLALSGPVGVQAPTEPPARTLPSESIMIGPPKIRLEQMTLADLVGQRDAALRALEWWETLPPEQRAADPGAARYIELIRGDVEVLTAELEARGPRGGMGIVREEPRTWPTPPEVPAEAPVPAPATGTRATLTQISPRNWYLEVRSPTGEISVINGTQKQLEARAKAEGLEYTTKYLEPEDELPVSDDERSFGPRRGVRESGAPRWPVERGTGSEIPALGPSPRGGPHRYVTSAEVVRRGEPISPEEDAVRDVAQRLKHEDPAAVKLAARDMAPRVPANAILVPIPDHLGRTEANAHLAMQIAGMRPGVVVRDVLGRQSEAPSSRARRQAGEPGLTIDEQLATLTLTRRYQPSHFTTEQPVLLVDNVITSGATGAAAARLLGRPDARVLAYAQAPVPAGETRANVGVREPAEAYHGTGANLEGDRFRNERIGTGQGAQTFGYGHYFAEEPNVARTYRPMNIGTAAAMRFRGEKLPPLGQVEAFAAFFRAQGIPDAEIPDLQAATDALEHFGGDLDYTIDRVKEMQGIAQRAHGERYNPQYYESRLRGLRKYGREFSMVRPGGLYRVTLDVEPHELLDWDAPLSAQSPFVKAAIESLAHGDDREPVVRAAATMLYSLLHPPAEGSPTETGESFYNIASAMSRSFTTKREGRTTTVLGGDKIQAKKHVSEVLRSVGIKGIRYLDQWSRARSEGTRNFVIFDERDIGEPQRVEARRVPYEAGGVPDPYMIPQESVSSGAFGIVPELKRAPETIRRTLTRELDELLSEREQALVNELTGQHPTVIQRRGLGMFQGEINPTTVFDIPPEAGPAYASTLAVVRGLSRAQDAQVWVRRILEVDPETMPANAYQGFVVYLTEEEYRAIGALIAANLARFQPIDGSTWRDGEALFVNYDQALPDETHADLLEEAIATALPEGVEIKRGQGIFQGEYIDGPRAYFRTLGRRPDSLRRVAGLFADAIPAFERAGRATAAALGDAFDHARFTERVAAHLESLTKAADYIEASAGRLAALPRGDTRREILEITQILADRSRSLRRASPEARRARAIEVGMADLLEAYRRFAHAVDWYELDFPQAHALTYTLLPSLREPAKRVLFDAVAAIISNGNKVRPNWAVAIAVFQQYLDTGKFSLFDPATLTQPLAARRYGKGIKGHQRQDIHEGALTKLQQLVDSAGEAGAAQQLSALSPRGPRRPELVTGFYHLLGEDPKKTADFFASAIGLPDFVAVDLWMQRWRYATQGYLRTKPKKVKVGERWVVARDARGRVVQILDDAPTDVEAREIREWVRELANLSHDVPQLAHLKLKASGAQALIWYLTKARYAELGAKPDEAVSFADVAADLVFGARAPTVPVAEATPRVGEPIPVGYLASQAAVRSEVDVAFGSPAKVDQAIESTIQAMDPYVKRANLARQYVHELRAKQKIMFVGKQMLEVPSRSSIALVHGGDEKRKAAYRRLANKIGALLQPIRSPFMETLALTALREGKVLTSHILTSGALGSVSTLTPEGEDLLIRFLDEAQQMGADEVVTAHNHPSGDTHPSDWGGDKGFYYRLVGLAELRGMRGGRHYIIDGDTFTQVTITRQAGAPTLRPGEKLEVKHYDYAMEMHPYRRRKGWSWNDPAAPEAEAKLKGPHDVVEVVSQTGRTDNVQVLFVNHASHIVGFESHGPAITTDNVVRFAKHVVNNGMRFYGAASVIIVVPPKTPSYDVLTSMARVSDSFHRAVMDIIRLPESAADEIVSASARGEIDQVYRRQLESALMDGLRATRVAALTDPVPWPGRPGYMVDGSEQAARPQQPIIGQLDLGIPFAVRAAIGPAVGENGLPSTASILAQSAIDAARELGVTEHAEGTITKLLEAFAGTRMEQIGAPLHFLLVEYERQRTELAEAVQTDILKESLNRSAVAFLAGLPYMNEFRATSILSWFRDKLPKALGGKLGVTPDRQAALFNAVEAIAEWQPDGQPVFRDVLERSGELDETGYQRLLAAYGSPEAMARDIQYLEDGLERIRKDLGRRSIALSPSAAAVERYKLKLRAKQEVTKIEARQILANLKAERDAKRTELAALKAMDPAVLDEDAQAALPGEIRRVTAELNDLRASIHRFEGVTAGRASAGPAIPLGEVAAATDAIEAKLAKWRELRGQSLGMFEVLRARRSQQRQFAKATRVRQGQPAAGDVRVTADEARRRWDALTPTEQGIVRRFALDAEAARQQGLSHHVNRELAKLEYDISSDLEAYVHHYGFEDEGAMVLWFGSALRRKKMIAGARQRRGGAEGFKRHLEGARLHGGLPLALENLQHEYAEALEHVMFTNPDPNLVLQLRPAEQPPAGYQLFEDEGRRTAYRVLAQGEAPEAGFTERTRPDGTRVASKFLEPEEAAPEGYTRVLGRFGTFKGTPYAVANPIYKHLEYFQQPPPAAPTTDERANAVWETLRDHAAKLVYYWALNQLISLGTASRNFLGGAVQYATRVAEQLAAGDLHGAQTSLLALARAMAPATVRQVPKSEFGASQQTLRELDEAHGALRAFMTTALVPFGAVENFFKRALTLSTRELEAQRIASDMVRQGLIPKSEARRVAAELYRQPTFEMRMSEELVRDAFAYNYNNIPLALKKMNQTAIGKAIIPFPIYGYKFSRHVGRYTGAIGRLARNKGKPGDLQKAIAALIIFGVPAVLTWLGDEESEAETTDPGSGVKYDFDRSGRVYVGKNAEGLELWLRSNAYAHYGLGAVIGHTLHDRKAIEMRNYLSEFYSIGPGVQVMDYVRQVRNRYQTYRNGAAVAGDFARSWIPAHRPLEAITHIVDPVRRKQETFSEAVLLTVPLPEQTLNEVGLSRGVPRTASGGRQLVPGYDPWLEFQREFFGLNLKPIDPVQAQDEYRRAAARAQAREQRSEVQRRRLQNLEERRRSRQEVP